MGITLVTSFFDIGRESNEIKSMSRGNNEYVNYFRTWARIRNPLVIYTENKMAQILLNVRREYGRERETTIIVIDDIYSILPDVFNRMKAVESDESFQRFRFYSKAMSNQANYCYLVLLQYGFISDVVKRGLVDDVVAWIDLGFNHGLKYYTEPGQFDFLWDFKFDNNINAFALFNPDQISSVDSLQFQKDCFMGGFLTMKKELAENLWNYIYEAESSLLNIGCMDDDQQLLLMSYKKYGEFFTVHICNWFEPLLLCGCGHLSHREERNHVYKKSSEKIKRINNLLTNKGFIIRTIKRMDDLFRL